MGLIRYTRSLYKCYAISLSHIYRNCKCKCDLRRHRNENRLINSDSSYFYLLIICYFLGEMAGNMDETHAFIYMSIFNFAIAL